MNTLAFVVGIALTWHIGLVLFERSRRMERKRILPAKLLLMAEVDLLKTLRSELTRFVHLKGDRGSERKLFEVEERLRELDGNAR